MMKNKYLQKLLGVLFYTAITGISFEVCAAETEVSSVAERTTSKDSGPPSGIPAKAIRFPLPWQQGTTYRYEVVSGRSTPSPDGIQAMRELGAEQSLRVVKQDANGVELLISDQNARLLNAAAWPDAAERAMIETLIRAGEKISARVKLDVDGAYLGVENWEELAGLLNQSMSTLIPELAKVVPEVQREAFMQTMQKMQTNMSTQEAINATYSKRLTFLFALTGSQMAVGETRTYDDRLPLPMAPGEFLPVQGEIFLMDEKPGDEWFEMRLHQKASGESLMKAVDQVLKAMMPEGTVLPDDQKLELQNRLDLRDFAELHISRSSGAVSFYQWKRQIGDEALGRTELTTYRLKEIIRDGQNKIEKSIDAEAKAAVGSGAE